MERCYECGKRDWRIGSTYRSIRRWFRKLVGLDKYTTALLPSSILRDMLERNPLQDSELSCLRPMAEIRPLPPAGQPIFWHPMKFTDKAGE